MADRQTIPLPCPFCGDVPDVFRISAHRKIASVECNNDCTVRPSAHDGLPLEPEPAIRAECRLASAIHRWNQRA